MKKILVPVALSILAWAAFGHNLQAGSPDSSSKAVDIHDDSGGMIIDYALRTAEYRESAVQVRFTGRCDSACTLFLSLPTAQLCVDEKAYFRFHAPVDDENKIDDIAIELLMQKYPEWVTEWINDRGGLDSRLLTMTATDVLPHIRSCQLAS